MEQIQSKDNKWIKEFCKLSSSKSYREEKGSFALEGIKLVKEAYDNHVKLEMVFVTMACYDKRSQELEKLFQEGKCAVITSEVEKKMSLTKSPQGLFAICSKLDKCLSLDKIYLKGRYVMLIDLQDAGNVGSIIRTAEAVGIDGIIATKSTCDFFNPKVIRGSMGSVFRMPTLIVDDEKSILDELKAHDVATYASVVDSSVIDLSSTIFNEKSVLLIGNEGNGLSREVAERCSNMVTIKMMGNAESLNASMAACILMWEMTKK